MLRNLKTIRNVSVVIVIFALFWLWATRATIYTNADFTYGVTFSPEQATSLGLDWKTVYLATLDELQIKKIRLSAYWDIIEKEQGKNNWEELDWLLTESEKRNVELILVVGGRVPRWPECHLPEWTNNFDVVAREKSTLEYIARVVERYKGRQVIKAWQVENEPFLVKFGQCPPFRAGFLDEEIDLVRKLDSRPIVVTDSGELSLWVPAARRADIFGTTLYRNTYSNVLSRYIHYPITPTFFKIKRNLTSLFAQPKKWVVIELQAEPWAKDSYQLVTEGERDKTMSPEKFTEMMAFVKQTGFDTFYLWGVEWWYWEKELHNRPFFWDEAKKIYN